MRELTKKKNDCRYGNAVVDVLTGVVNPSGKLPLTLPARDNQVNFSKAQWPGVDMVSTYSEGLLIGWVLCLKLLLRKLAEHSLKCRYSPHEVKYVSFLLRFASYRWYDAHGEDPAFPFGHGLSYTGFSIQDLAVESPPSTGANQTIVFNVTNIGSVEGTEVAQLVRVTCRIVEPVAQLRQFDTT